MCLTGEAPAFKQRSVSNRGSKVTAERVALLVLSALLAAAIIVIYRLIFANIQTKKSFQTLRDEHEALKRNLTDETICEEGWEQHGGKCYYFSNNSSPWENSREDCRQQGGDLVKIDSREEQTFLELKVREKMNYFEDRFWIGLTDSKEEGTWLWVDGSPLYTSSSFWSGVEPDNWTEEDPDGEDCARMGEIARHLWCWFDKSCKVPHRQICEKQAETGN
ncbi:immune-related, lectin-like receptor 4 [Micropterus dolomieu]|uniref:immune-related, lectin-like receptor 4 n=1 Tax=Micropterus dolomieu TaxID=147949 RepID=UPI001E8EA2AC|nr:immune-related, lectin-like receptor 4 [Micropterus dolomieu]